VETWKKINNGEIHSLKIEDKSITNQQSIAETFNTHFLTRADNINNNKNQDYTKNKYNTINNDNSTPIKS
jgi:hypothetical protein